MASPVLYLEATARKYAKAAARAEAEEKYDEALSNIRKAIEALAEIVRYYPEHPLYRSYLKLLYQYRRKERELASKLKPIPIGVDLEEDEPGEEPYLRDGEPPGFVLTRKPRVSFKDIADLEEAKRAIKEAIVYPVRRPDLFPLGWPRGILLFGPPGTGKTMLAAAVASEIDAEFIYVDAASIMSKWLGEGEKNVRKLFSYARSRAELGRPVVIFIDEIDALLGVFSNEVGGEVRVRNQFLKEMDGLQDKFSKVHVYVIGATNKPWSLDEAFIRRFQKRIYTPLPDESTRRKILELLTSKIRLSRSVDLGELARVLEGYTGSDIRDIVQEAYMNSVREYFEKGSKEIRPVEMRDFMEALRRRKPSVAPDLIRKYEEWARRFEAL